jgi:hypothetical protein
MRLICPTLALLVGATPALAADGSNADRRVAARPSQHAGDLLGQSVAGLVVPPLAHRADLVGDRRAMPGAEVLM